MQIYELCELFIDWQDVRIYDLDNNKVVYEGDAYDIPYELGTMEISSIDNLYKRTFDGYFTINIDLSEEN